MKDTDEKIYREIIEKIFILIINESFSGSELTNWIPVIVANIIKIFKK